MTASTRRAALGALARVSALALPAIAIAAPATSGEHLDAELFALIAAAREVSARIDAAENAAEQAYERTEKVPWPQALVVTEDDTRLWKLKAGDPFELGHLDLMRRRQAHRQSAKHVRSFSVAAADAPYMAALDDKDRALIEMMAAAEAGEDRLIAALDQWNEARRLARDQSGETAADEWLKKVQAEYDEACERIARMRAHTLSGVLAKLAFITPTLDVATWMERGAEGGTHEEIMYSVAVDYKLSIEGAQQA
jgi:hypothetical protein